MTKRLDKLLEEMVGMDPRVLGDKNLARVIRERMSACKLPDEERYLEKARSSSREMEALIEAVVVPETLFFRDKGPFTFLREYVREEWIPARRGEPLRILSAPCSSGEEPYSIAIVLQEAGLKPDKYRIDALDVSRALLRKAERATYTRHSFRDVAEAVRNLYFVAVGDEYILKNEIRQGVQFIHGNLLDERVLADKRPYDVVFCRNLLIYLSTEARARVVRNIDRLMVQNGLLFVGHAETANFPTARFAPLHHRGAFGFRKAEGRTVAAAGPGAVLAPIIVSSTPVKSTPRTTQGAVRPSPAPATDVPKAKFSLEEARQLADQGRLLEAGAMCERLLLDDPVNADVYCLLGVVLHGLGNLQRAEECFARAIYLDEHSYEAVVHLMLLKEHRGDSQGAEVLRRRAARIRPSVDLLK